MKNKPASISLDLDNEWSYLKTQGVSGWENSPGYLPLVVPRILDTLAECGQKITFFVVGKDAVDPKNQSALRSIVAAGHEVANHSWLHEPWLHLYSQEQLEEEFSKSEEAIRAATGQAPRGFRGPGFSSSPLVREVLKSRGYAYDASVFPSVLGPVARLFFMLNSKLSLEEKKKRQGLYGKFSDAFGPLRPFRWANGLAEIPVTTMPLLRLPIHMSYLLFLAQKSSFLAKLYWKTAVLLCRLRGVQPSLLLHPTDFLDLTDVPSMEFFPAMRLPAARKIALVKFAITALQKHWDVLPMGAHAERALPTAAVAKISSLEPKLVLNKS